MKNILVPTDFSKNADNALYYAIELAKKENAKLILLHAYNIKYESGAVPYSLIAEETAGLKKESNKQLKESCLKITHAGKIKYESLSIEGFTVDVILNISKEKEIDMVVMGTKGATGFSNVIFGSNTAKIIEKAKCPIIAVPEDASFQSIKKITYATSYNHSDFRALKKIVEIAEPFNAQINVLHISDNIESPEIEKGLMKAFMEEVNHKIQYNNISFQIMRGENIEDALEEYIEEGSTNMLVMSTHHRNFFDKIFGKSVTKHMAYHTKIPLMAFHYNSKTSVKIF
ncbi:MAG: universal stress protein [Bacteroidota bacterium]